MVACVDSEGPEGPHKGQKIPIPVPFFPPFFFFFFFLNRGAKEREEKGRRGGGRGRGKKRTLLSGKNT
jgi:hypothetical protein